MSDRLEGWSYPVSETIPVSGLKILDHTFVKAPGKGPAFFDCFGGHASPKAHAIAGAAGNGDYSVANCYRMSLGLPDTAGLGLYATHGVCHQAANRFLWSACGVFSGPTIHNAQAYMLTFAMYGTYGRPLVAPPPPVPRSSLRSMISCAIRVMARRTSSEPNDLPPPPPKLMPPPPSAAAPRTRGRRSRTH